MARAQGTSGLVLPTRRGYWVQWYRLPGVPVTWAVFDTFSFSILNLFPFVRKRSLVGISAPTLLEFHVK